jgi:glycosyltransferase EpsH
MNVQPIVSVIIPIYNAKHTLARCLDSLLAQTLKEIEILCVDDCSVDGSLDIVRAYATQDNRIRALALEENKGPAVARNLGLENAVGMYIGFVDADDWIESSMYAKLVDAIRATTAELAVCARFSFQETDAPHDESAIPTSTTKDPIFIGAAPHLLARLTTSHGEKIYEISSITDLGFLIANISDFIWDKLFDARLIARHRFRFIEGGAYGEDTLFLDEYLGEIRTAVLLNEPLYHYNAYREGSVTNTLSDKWFDIYTNLGKLITHYRNRETASNYAAIAPYLCDLSVRYYDRRANALHRYGNKHLQWRFTVYSHDFLSKHFPDWKIRMNRHPDIVLARVKTNLMLMRLYILTPNALKRIFVERTHISISS